jgi:hypothetical protein
MSRKVPIGRFRSTTRAKKIQAICNGKSTPFTMQGLAMTREKPPAQEQWEAMEKTMRTMWEEQWEPAEVRTNAYVRL